MEREKLNFEEYEQVGFGDLYFGLINFIGRYAQQNFNPIEIFENDVSYYAFAVLEMKKSLKLLLGYLLTVDEVFLLSLNRNVKLKTLNIEEQAALEERCKEYILLNLNKAMEQKMQKLDNQKTDKTK